MVKYGNVSWIQRCQSISPSVYMALLYEIAIQLKVRLPNNVGILKKINIVDPKKVVSSPLTLILQEIGEVASSFDILGGKPFNIAALEGKTCRLRNTTMDSNCASSTLVITAFSNGNNLFPQLVHLLSD